MVFIETEIFTKRIWSILSEEEYRFLQADLIRKPDRGKLIPRAKGLRKLRWSSRSKGKRGGARVLYFLYTKKEQIYMIYAFRKSEQSDLTPEQLKSLTCYVKEGVL